MESNLRPLGDNILVEIISSKKDKQIDGIYLPDNITVFSDVEPDVAIVKQLGSAGGYKDPDKKFIPFSVKEGDTIIVEKMMGETLNSKKFPNLKLIKEEHILAILS